MIDALNAAGVDINDHSSAQLAMIFQSQKVAEHEVKSGCLVFYGDDDGIFHVMTVIDVWDNGYYVLAGACSGNKWTTDINKAAKKNAFVTVKPMSYWSSAKQFIADPFARG